MFKFTILLALGFIVSGCAHNRNPSVYVRSEGYAVDTNATFAFIDSKVESESLFEYSNRKKLIDACIETGRSAGIQLVKQSDISASKDRPKYLVAMVYGLEHKQQQEYVQPYTTATQTNCQKNYYGGVQCNSSGGQTYGGYTRTNNYFVKQVQVDILDNTTRRVSSSERTVRQLKAFLMSGTAEFKPETANSFCRAIMAEFPNDVSKEYQIGNPESPYLPTSK